MAVKIIKDRYHCTLRFGEEYGNKLELFIQYPGEGDPTHLIGFHLSLFKRYIGFGIHIGFYTEYWKRV